MVFISFHKPQSLITEKGGGAGGVGGELGNSSGLAWDMPKKSNFFFLCRDRKLNGKLVGGMRNWVSD